MVVSKIKGRPMAAPFCLSLFPNRAQGLPTQIVSVPNDVDPGDYHCGFSVTDVTGWQSRTSVDIKIAE